MTLLNVLHRIPEELSQSRSHKKCAKGIPKASEGKFEPTKGEGRRREGGGEEKRGAKALYKKFSCNAAIPKIPIHHLLNQK